MNHTKVRLVVQYPDGKFHQSGIDAPDRRVSNPLDADDVSGLLFLRDANPHQGGEIVEVLVTATLTGRRQRDLYNAVGKNIADLRDRVFENLKCAKENGDFELGGVLHGSNAEEIASDMIACAADVEDEEKEDLIPHVQAWLDQLEAKAVAS